MRVNVAESLAQSPAVANPRAITSAWVPFLIKSLERDGFHTSFVPLIFRLKLLGLTDAEIAEHFGITYRSFQGWCGRYPEVEAALKAGGEDADARVAESLYARALGYSHPEEKIFCTKGGKVVRAETTKHYPPNEVACMMFLSNRQRFSGRWRHQASLDLSNSDGSLFRMFTAGAREADRTLEGRYRVIGTANDADAAGDRDAGEG